MLWVGLKGVATTGLRKCIAIFIIFRIHMYIKTVIYFEYRKDYTECMRTVEFYMCVRQNGCSLMEILFRLNFIIIFFPLYLFMKRAMNFIPTYNGSHRCKISLLLIFNVHFYFFVTAGVGSAEG